MVMINIRAHACSYNAFFQQECSYNFFNRVAHGSFGGPCSLKTAKILDRLLSKFGTTFHLNTELL